MPSASVAVSPSAPLYRAPQNTEDKPRYVSPYKASRARTAKKSKKNVSNLNFVNQLGPNMFENTYAASPAKSIRPKGSFMQGTLSSTKKTRLETGDMSKTGTFLNANRNRSPLRTASPTKYMVP